jgi:TolB protein
MKMRMIANNKIRFLLITMLLLCCINATARQHLDSRDNQTLAVAPTLGSASQISSNNGLIAFSAANQIYVMNDDGSDVRRLTDGTPRVFNQYAAFSPDGQRVAFIRLDERTSEFALCVVDVDGSNLQSLINGTKTLSEPAWSPDGSRIAFVRGFDETIGGYAYNISCHGEIYFIDVATHKEMNLTRGEGGADPAWSPDGTRIAFSSFRDGYSEIYTMSPNGNDVERLTYSEKGAGEPAWSPSGNQIAYVSHLIQAEVVCGFIPTGRPGSPIEDWTRISVMESDGTNQVELGITSGGNEPTWSPDGASLAFVLSNKSGRQIYVTDSKGTSLMQLTSDSEQKSSPSWSNIGR